VHIEHLACRIWAVLKEAHVGNAQVQARIYATYWREYENFTHLPGYMIIVREHVHIGPHVVHHHREPLKQGIEVFGKLRRHGVKLNPEKCVFRVPRGMLLGFVVS
jgi:hypothetical protein